MGTRSNIVKVNADETVSVIYCHWDGYPEGVGNTLLEHYTDESKVDELIALGDLSSLGREVGTIRNDFDNPDRDICVAYGRDRGDFGTKASHLPTLNGYLKDDAWIEYVYVYHNGTWFMFTRDDKPVELKEIVAIAASDESVA